MKGLSVREICCVGLVTALICVIAPLSVPVGPIPVSLGLFAVYLAAALCRKRIAVFAVICYLLLGALGLPVFAGFSGGLSRLFSVTGGYLWGYIVCAWLGSFIIGRRPDRLLVYIAALAAGTLVCYLFGTLWFMQLSGAGFYYALSVCVAPFLLFDAMKILVASLLGRSLRSRLLPLQ